MKVMHRIRSWQKLALLVLVGIALSTAPTVLLFQKFAEDIAFSERELQGTETARKLIKVLHGVQKHRGLSAGVLGGNAAMSGQREAQGKLVTASFAALRDDISRDAGKLRRLFDRSERDWSILASAVDGRSLSVKESFQRHTQLAAAVLGMIDAELDHSWLIFDPEADGYFVVVAAYVHTPWLTEALGQARALGTGLLAQKQATQDDRFVATSLLNRASERMEAMQASMAKVMESNAELRGRLGPPLAKAAALTSKAIDLSQQEILQARDLSFPPSEYFAAYTQAIDAQFSLIEAMSHDLEGVLAKRLAKQGNYRLLVLLSAIAFLGLALALSYWITRSITERLGHAVDIANAIATGKLDNSIMDGQGSDEMADLLRSLQRMQQGLVEVVEQIQSASAAIHEASTQVATGNADLSSRTEEQASSLEEAAANMEELSATVKQNADHAHGATELVASAGAMASEGGKVVERAVTTMRSINDSSRRIVDIIAVIDGIAFQTNILSLNAAVEAARAGEQGRGFAVVASEVRNLSKRCAEAAKEIKVLIQTSASEVESGSNHVESVARTMSGLVDSVQHIAAIFGEISTASAEQSSGIGQMGQSIAQMDQVTQQNAALVEQAAAASLLLQDQAVQLGNVVAKFKVNGARSQATKPPLSPSRQSVTYREDRFKLLPPVESRA